MPKEKEQLVNLDNLLYNSTTNGGFVMNFFMSEEERIDREWILIDEVCFWNDYWKEKNKEQKKFELEKLKNKRKKYAFGLTLFSISDLIWLLNYTKDLTSILLAISFAGTVAEIVNLYNVNTEIKNIDEEKTKKLSKKI